jgi:RHH-type transcriptional regulator, proline utilization regulon repressor / proline dehydrogenase / delta 1-pyrroline-5-carboxylate dehydrogenase
MPYRDLEPRIRQIAADIQDRRRAHRRLAERAEEGLFDRLVSQPAARARLFQLVDTFPALHDTDDVYAHITQYLDDPAVPAAFRRMVRVARRLPGGERVAASAARRGIEHMATRFIAGRDAASARPAFQRLWDQNLGVIVDLLGEKTITDQDADRYAVRAEQMVSDLIPSDAARDPRRSIAVKPTAFAPRLDPLTADAGLDEAARRLLPLLHRAAEHGLLVWFDMEQYRVKDLTITLFRELLDDPALANLRAGIVTQAYLRDSLADLVQHVRWAEGRTTPIAIRLVKGAYWDTETVVARAHGWPVPVYERKPDTDANYERCTRFLLEHRGVLHPAFAGHNIRSISHAIAAADALGIDRRELEFQMLHGMEAGLAAAVRSLGPLVDVYVPIGELVPGMAYLVRRLLENSSNESFLRQASRAEELDALLTPPATTEVAA